MVEDLWKFLEKTGYPIEIIFTFIFFLALIFTILMISRRKRRRVSRSNKSVKRGEIKGRIVKVTDGDTIRVINEHFTDNNVKNIKNKDDFSHFKKGSFSVRLYAIDTPEKAFGSKPGQKYGGMAHDILENFCLDEKLTKKVSEIIGEPVKIFKECKLQTLSIDRYGRSLCVAKVGRTDLSMYMMRQGMAVVYYGGGAQYNSQRQ